MKILVTGASGLLGSKIVELALEKGFEVYSGYNTHYPSSGIPIKLDITNRDDVIRVVEAYDLEVIVHSAALTNVDQCEKNRDLAFKVNILGTKNLIESVKNKRIFFVYVSTDYVFDGKKGFYREEDRTNPINYYGYTKLEGEKTVMDSGLDFLIARTSVIYGAKPASGKVNFALWLIDMLSKKRKVKLLTDQFVSPTLNTNLAEMILEAIDNKFTGVFHMSGCERASRYEFGVKLAKIFGYDKGLIRKATMDEMKWVAKRPRDSSLDVSKVRKKLRTKPLNVEESLKMLRRELEHVARDSD